MTRSIINRFFPALAAILSASVAHPALATRDCNDLLERVNHLPRSIVIYFSRRVQKATEAPTSNESQDFRQLFTENGRVRPHLDTIYEVILDSHGSGSLPPNEVAANVARQLDLPPEWARSIVLYYDLENHYEHHPEEAATVREESKALGRPSYEKPEVSIPSQWNDWFLGFSNQKTRFEAERDQAPFLPLRGVNDSGADSMWFNPIYARWLGITGLTQEHPSENLNQWITTHQARLRSLWGYFVELNNLGLAGDRTHLIPGAAIQVGGRPHADAWRYHWSHEADKAQLVVDSFEESKASVFGLEKGKNQIQRFLRDLFIYDSATVFGQRMVGKDILLQTLTGPRSLEQLREIPELKQLMDPKLSYEAFSILYKKYFSQDFFHLHLPKDEAPPPGFETVGTIVPGNKTRSEQKREFLMWVAQRLNRRNFLWTGGNVTPEQLDSILAADTGSPFFFANGGSHEISPAGKSSETDRSTWDPLARHWHDANLPSAFPDERHSGKANHFGSFTVEADAFFEELSHHLPSVTRAEIAAQAPINKSDGSTARKGYQTSILRVANRMSLLVQAHNAWAKENGKPEIPSDLSTVDGLKIALEALKEASLDGRKATDPEFAYHKAWFDHNLVDAFPLGKTGRKSQFGSFNSETDFYFAQMAKHLPESVQAEIQRQSPIARLDGGNARSGSYDPTARVANRLKLLVEKHNVWAKQHNLPEILSDLTTLDGARQAVELLKKASIEAQIKLDPDYQFKTAWLEKDLIDAFPKERHGQQKSQLGSFNTETDSYLDQLALSLPEATRQRMIEQTPVGKDDGGQARHGNPLATLRIANRLRLIVEEFNKLPTEPGRSAAPAHLVTIAEVSQALTTLRDASRRAQLADPDVAYEAAWIEKDLRAAFPPAVRGKTSRFGSFFHETDIFFEQLARHLPNAVQEEIKTEAPVLKGDGNNSNGGHSPVIRIAKRLKLLVEKHNQWAKAHGKPLISDDLTAPEGIRAAVNALKAVSLEARKESDPQLAYETAWIEKNLVNAFPKQPGKKTLFGSFQDETDEYFDEIARHLPPLVQDEIKSETPIKPSDGGQARKGFEEPTISVANRLKLLLEKHNAWAKEKSKPEIKSDLKTTQGVGDAITGLQSAALEYRKQENPHFAYQMAWLENNLIQAFPAGSLGIRGQTGSFTASTDKYFDQLAQHLPPAVQATINEQTPIRKGDGGEGKRGMQSSIIRVAERMELLVRMHNQWAKAHREPEITADLNKMDGVAQAFQILRAAAIRAANP